MKQLLQDILIGIFMAMMIIFFFITHSGCSYSPVRFDGIPEECNFMYSTMALVAKNDDKSLVDDTIESCEKAINRQRTECIYLIYGNGGIEKGDINKFKEYRKCINDKL